MRWLVALAWIACTTGAPLTFHGGDGQRYTFPLVGSLEGGPLLVPVMIGEQGPYLFAIDPDSLHTVVSARVVFEAKLRVAQRRRPIHDERGQRVPELLVEVPAIRFGDLAVTGQVLRAIKTGRFDRRGRRIEGVIGRDILRDTLVLTVDRDRAIGTLSTVAAFQPDRANGLRFTVSRSNRHVVDAEVNGHVVPLHLDLGSEASQLATSLWPAARLESTAIRGVVVTEYGGSYPVAQQARPAPVRVGAIRSSASFIPYEDRLDEHRDVQGALGLDFFDPFDVALHWQRETYYLAPRTPESYELRVARWPASPFAGCTQPGCVTLRVVEREQRIVLEAEREQGAAGTDLEVYVAIDEMPQPPHFVINLPSGADSARVEVDRQLVTKTPSVLDASPYPRTCPGPGGCIDKLARW